MRFQPCPPFWIMHLPAFQRGIVTLVAFSICRRVSFILFFCLAIKRQVRHLGWLLELESSIHLLCASAERSSAYHFCVYSRGVSHVRHTLQRDGRSTWNSHCNNSSENARRTSIQSHFTSPPRWTVQASIADNEHGVAVFLPFFRVRCWGTVDNSCCIVIMSRYCEQWEVLSQTRRSCRPCETVAPHDL